MIEAVDGTIHQISSSSFGWWSSSECSLHVALFHEAFCLVVGQLAGWVNSGPRGKNLTGMGPEKKTTPGFGGVELPDMYRETTRP